MPGRAVISVAALQRWLEGECAEELVLTVEEAAERMHVNPRTVMRAIRAGQLKASQLNQGRGGWRIYESALKAWMDERAERATKAPEPQPAQKAPRKKSPVARPRRSAHGTDGRLFP
jgi:excisionase family DNA binding protein